MNKWLLGISTAVLFFSLSVGCSSKPADNLQSPPAETTAKPTTSEPMVLQWSITGEPSTMDAGIATDSTSMDMINLTFEGLTSVDRQGQMINAIAESYTHTPDFTHFTFTIRKDAKWSNGDPVTAHDFEYAIKRNLDPKTASGYAYQLFYIKGGEDFYSGKGKQEDVGVKAKDDYTLDFTLRSPTPFFRELTSFTTYYPLHKKTIESNPQWAAEAKTIVGNGPFVMDTWEHKSKLTFSKSPTYWDTANVKLDQIHIVIIEDNNTALSMFENGDLDWGGYPSFGLSPDAVGQIKEEGKLLVADNPGTKAVIFNTEKPPFTNKKIRQAFSYSINRQQLVDNILQTGVPPAYGWVPVSMGLNPDGYFKEDVAKAKQLLAEGMKELGLTQFPKVTYYYDTGETDKKLAQALQGEWKKTLGVDIDIRTAEWKVFNEDVQNGKYDFGIWLWGADFNDPINFLEMYKDLGGNNVVRFDNKEYRDLLNKSYYETDEQKRKQLMFDAEKILMEEMPLAPLHFRGNAYVKNDKVKDFVIFPLGGSYFKYAYIEK
ncbi:peptide ABC transporter substrate-binding protein [Brevibacillus formosus]|uniref:ABC transporter substrate-binding protein n=1 Tax=Brevibacillus formosus TaxID=54913 RepID=A0A837KMK9_9BACL|nr:peptide ABC transporter substrate-binding protein [Brevibacillus formosus]KLH98818.1 ABC transporter substrate-binding protein [Brevibacillus formosus]MED1958119.1 peptide ABC transporter substrate-binding protein [Brevibacillus formosus]PSJ93633.1 peptide ABC transporter substrate-binding protein [Brevibacillus formosus]GED59442.1 oligopeptide-binding protein OppA [Brevibacillus formosus]